MKNVGSTDLLGVGKIVGHITELILGIIKHRSLRERRELENQELAIKNVQKLVVLAKKLGYPPSEIRKLMGWVDHRQTTFTDLVDSRKIRSVNPIPRKNKSRIDRGLSRPRTR